MKGFVASCAKNCPTILNQACAAGDICAWPRNQKPWSTLTYARWLQNKTGEAGNTQKGGNTCIAAGYEILARIAQLNTYIDITAVTLTGTRRPIYQSPEIGSLAWSTIAWQGGVASYACNMAGMTEIVCVSFKKGAVATVAVIFAGFVIHNEVSVAAITWTHCQPKEIHHDAIGSLVGCIVLSQGAIRGWIHVEDSSAGSADVKSTHTKKHSVSVSEIDIGRKRQDTGIYCVR